MLRGDVVKDDSGSCAASTEGFVCVTNDSSESDGCHWKTTGLCRTSSRCGMCLHTRKMEDAPKLFKLPKSECPDKWIRLPRHKWQKSWSGIEDSMVPLERNLHGHPLAGLLWERQVEEVLSSLERKKYRTGNVFFSSKTGIVLIGLCG